MVNGSAALVQSYLYYCKNNKQRQIETVKRKVRVAEL